MVAKPPRRGYRRKDRRAQVHLIGCGRRVVPGAVAVAIAVALCGPHAATARQQAVQAARTCSPITLRMPSPPSGTVPTRVMIERRGVTCANAHRLIDIYLRRVSPRTCASRGNVCPLPVGDGWACNFVTGGASEATGGAILACARSTGASFTVVPVTAVTE